MTLDKFNKVYWSKIYWKCNTFLNFRLKENAFLRGVFCFYLRVKMIKINISFITIDEIL